MGAGRTAHGGDSPIHGALKLGLEALLPLARLARRGEAIRVGAVRNRPT
jgi:hypothetical protein